MELGHFCLASNAAGTGSSDSGFGMTSSLGSACKKAPHNRRASRIVMFRNCSLKSAFHLRRRNRVGREITRDENFEPVVAVHFVDEALVDDGKIVEGSRQ